MSSSVTNSPINIDALAAALKGAVSTEVRLAPESIAALAKALAAIVKGDATTTTSHTTKARKVADSSYASRWAQETYPALLDELYPKNVPTTDGKGVKRADGYLFNFTSECKKRYPEAYANFLDGSDGLLDKIKAEKGAKSSASVATTVDSSASSVVSSASTTSSRSAGVEKAKITNLKKLLTQYGVAFDESATLSDLEGLRDTHRAKEASDAKAESTKKKEADKAEREKKAAAEKTSKSTAAAEKKMEAAKAKAEKELARVVEWLDARNIVHTGLNLEQMLVLEKTNAGKRKVKPADRKIGPKSTISAPVPASLKSSSSAATAATAVTTVTTVATDATEAESTFKSVMYDGELYDVDENANAYLTDKDGNRVFAGRMETVEGEEGEESFLNTEAEESD